ncbi:MAG: hypothetical protein WKG00_15495 [Polyangiaceae bacterium]
MSTSFRALRATVALAAAVLSFGTTGAARAENLRDVPLGSRTAAMGGAGVASGSDAAMPFLNPAGVAGTPNDVLSVSANVYSGLGATVDGYYAPGGLDPRYGDATIDEDSLAQKHLAVMPSAVTFFKRFGADDDPYRHVLALSLMAPSFNQYDVDGSFRAAGSSHRLTADTLGQDRFRQLFAGATYALSAADRRFRFGASLFATYADLLADVHQLTLTGERDAGDDTIATSNDRSIVDVTSLGLTAAVGAQVRLFDALWVGVAAESVGIPVWGTGRTQRARDVASFDSATGESTQDRLDSQGELDDARISRPFRFSAGLAYDRPDAFALAVDIHVMPAHGTFREWSGTAHVVRAGSGSELMEGDEPIDYRRGTRSTVNYSVGGEVHVSRKTTLRAGVYTDRDVVEDQSPGQETRNARLDWTVFTLGVGHSFGPVGTSYGVAYRLGDGTAPTRDVFGSDPNRFIDVQYTAHGVMLMLSGAVTTDEVKE